MPLNPPQDYRKTAYIHRSGLAAARPAAADVLPGTLYFSTDTVTLERSDGAVWSNYSGGGGTPGTAGSVGPPGLDGDEYDYFPLPGNTGPSGATGSAGISGATGAPGSQGLDGEDGESSFIPGPTGLTGNVGASGSAGIIGPAGIDGEDGESFLIPGPVGPSGSIGNTGLTGIGIPGLDAEEPIDPIVFPGPAGSTGATGASGGIITLKKTSNQTINGGASVFVDITGLTFPVVNGVDYAFKFYIVFQSAITTTGWRASVNHPGGTVDHFATVQTVINNPIPLSTWLHKHNVGVDEMSIQASTVTALVDLVFIIEGRYMCTANGTFAARFANELAANTDIVVQKGSYGFYF